jgi:hypothetical protein
MSCWDWRDRKSGHDRFSGPASLSAAALLDKVWIIRWIEDDIIEIRCAPRNEPVKVTSDADTPAICVTARGRSRRSWRRVAADGDDTP